jgi:hypothetical protein
MRHLSQTDKPSVQKIFQYWHSIVFVGVEGVQSKKTVRQATDMHDADLSFENALADLDLDDQSDRDEIDEDLFRSSSEFFVWLQSHFVYRT